MYSVPLRIYCCWQLWILRIWIWVSTWPSICMSWPMPWYPEGGWYITSVFLKLIFSLNAFTDFKKWVLIFYFMVVVCHRCSITCWVFLWITCTWLVWRYSTFLLQYFLEFLLDCHLMKPAGHLWFVDLDHVGCELPDCTFVLPHCLPHFGWGFEHYMVSTAVGLSNYSRV